MVPTTVSPYEQFEIGILLLKFSKFSVRKHCLKDGSKMLGMIRIPE